MEEKEEILRPNNGYGKFAAWTVSVAVLFIGIAELCGIGIDRGKPHVALLRIGGVVSFIVGMSSFSLFLLATNVHILNCRTLRRISKKRKQSKDSSITNNSQTIQNKERDED